MNRLRVVGGVAVSILSLMAIAEAAPPAAAKAKPSAAKQSPYRNTGHSNQVEQYYEARYGINHLQVQRTSSGELIRFTYRVVDARKATDVRNKQAEPHLIDLHSHAMLTVPTMENIGKLRQTEAIENGKEYWVLFSNKGNLVKLGSRVDVVIGDFYANGLTVN